MNDEKLGQAIQRPDHILQFFAYAHLPERLQSVSKPFGEMAGRIVETLPQNPERTVALRKLLESKDAAVRALLAVATCLALMILCGCGASMHLKKESPAEKAAKSAPPAKVTRTVTETVKVEKPVPVYQTITTTTSATKTLDDKGRVAPDLHKVELKIPEPVK